MTEAEWLAATNPRMLLEYVKRRASKRKPRLFSVACCRRIWPLIADDRSRAAVQVAERFADGQATSEELHAAEAEAESIWLKDPLDEAAMACFHVCSKQVAGLYAAVSTVVAIWSHRLGEARKQGNPIPDGMAYTQPIKEAEEAEQCRLLRDIFGNPFRRVKCFPEWRTSTAVELATQMYESREFSAMPILADALQDAGCDNEDVLAHCRGPGPHVRGCWVVDLVLGKE
jgi:hypothetical protein